MKTKWKIALAAGAVLALAGGVALAQMDMSEGHGRHGMMHSQMMQQHMAQGPGMQHGGMHGGSMHGGTHGATSPKGDQGPASLAFQGVNQKMHAGMDITFSGDADADFIKGMIPHHQGAVDMAKIVLAFGKDPAIRKLAEGIVKAQEEEISFMSDWLKKSGR